MKYPAPDGYIIESDPNGPVIYTLSCDWIPEGIYESHETTSAATTIGIKQIKIVRVVENETMTITVTESTEQELIDYKNSLV
jgi:hypothetical protein